MARLRGDDRAFLGAHAGVQARLPGRPLVALPFLLLLAAPLKRVQLRGTMLVVSNYFRSSEIECTEIAEVLEKRLLNIRPVWVFFKSPTPFGTRLAFIPHLGAVLFWKPHPVVEQLREVAGHGGGLGR